MFDKLFSRKPKETFDPSNPRFSPIGITAIGELTEKLDAHYAATGFPVGGVTETFKAAAIENTSETPREMVSAADRFTVGYHVQNMTAILTTLETRRSSLLETMRVDREDFEAREAANAAKVAELEQLQTVYSGALKIAAPGGDDGYGEIMRPAPVNPVALAETRKARGDINPRRRPARHPIENTN